MGTLYSHASVAMHPCSHATVDMLLRTIEFELGCVSVDQLLFDLVDLVTLGRRFGSPVTSSDVCVWE